MESVSTLVIGGGQAGLAMSQALNSRGLEHLVVERGRVAERWRSERWDSLAFQFPNWSLKLPGSDYDGPDPDGFSDHAAVCRRIERYAETIAAPVRTGVEVATLSMMNGGFRADTSTGEIEAHNVVLATGPFQRPKLPAVAAMIPPRLFQVHSSGYRNPDQLPPGGVLVVGSGGSGVQIAEELAQSGRDVVLAVSRHRRVPRRRHGRDILWWLERLGWMDRLASSLPGGRIPPTLLITGVGGGHDIDLRDFYPDRLTLVGRLREVDGPRLLFDDNAQDVLAAADTGYGELVTAIDDNARATGIALSSSDKQRTFESLRDAPTSLDVDEMGIASIVWCTGYAFDYDWVQVPCFTGGAPAQEHGVSTVPGLYFLGLHWMHTFKSGVLWGVGADAAHLAAHITNASR